MATHQNDGKRPAKAPQDHKQPKDKPQTVTINGVRITVDGSRMDDLQFVETLYDLNADPEGNALNIIPFLRGLFGDQYPAFRKAITDKDTGIAPVSKLEDIITDVFRQLAPNS